MMSSEVVLTTGETIRVTQDPETVMDALARSSVFVPLEDMLGRKHWVRREHVVTVRQGVED
jgi:hypothetical protein